jgi:hypothetical protein
MKAILLLTGAVVAIAVVAIAMVSSLSDEDAAVPGGQDRPAGPSRPGEPEETPDALPAEVETAAMGGWVGTPDGNPVAGAAVDVYRFDEATGLGRRKGAPIATVSTDRRGRFGLPDLTSGAWLLVAHVKGHTAGLSLQRRFVEGVPVRVRMVLHPHVRISGRLLTTRGEPVAGAELELRPARVVEAFHLKVPGLALVAYEIDRSTVSEESGAFEFDDLPPGIYDIHIAAEGMVRKAAFSVHAPGAGIEILLRRGLTLRGLVYGAPETRLPSVRVRTKPGGSPAKIEMDRKIARFVIENAPPGHIEVIASG